MQIQLTPDWLKVTMLATEPPTLAIDPSRRGKIAPLAIVSDLAAARRKHFFALVAFARGAVAKRRRWACDLS